MRDAASGLPATARFTTAALPPRDRFAVWKESISVLFDVRPRHAGNDDDGFHASITTTRLGSLLFAETEASPQVFLRDLQRVCGDGIDTGMVQLYVRGRARARFHDVERTIEAGDLVFFDAAQPSLFVCEDFTNLTLAIPRPLLDGVTAGVQRLHGFVLPRDHPATILVAENLMLMRRVAPRLDEASAGPIAEGLLGLVARCLSVLDEGSGAQAPDVRVATLAAVKRHLEARLGDRDLGPDAVLGAFRMSRGYLYGLFEPYGGVMHYIQRRRLVRALEALRDPANRHRKVADIAFALGFTSESHFSRSFRRTFGITPSAARERPPATDMPDDDGLVDRRYEAWLRDIGA